MGPLQDSSNRLSLSESTVTAPVNQAKSETFTERSLYVTNIFLIVQSKSGKLGTFTKPPVKMNMQES